MNSSTPICKHKEFNMKRRSFCKLIAAAAAANAMPAVGQIESAVQPELPGGFNRYTRSYADFCALPPEKRVFYQVSGNKIVETRSEEHTSELQSLRHLVC